MCQCFRTWQTVTFWRAHHCLNDPDRGDFVYTCFKRSNAKWHIQHQKITWSFWNLDQYLRLFMEYLLLYDNFVIGSLQGMPQSDCLPVPALRGKPADGEWWGVIGSVFVLSISEFKWILRFKIQVRSIYHLQSLKMPISRCLHLYQQCFLSCCYFARYETKCNMTTSHFEKSKYST